MSRVLDAVSRVPFIAAPTPVEELTRLRAVLPRAPRLLIKRDDVIPFGFGGNKIRKLEYVAARAVAERADTLVTCGGVQSNHARATAAAAATLGMKAVLIVNGERPLELRGNALLGHLLGAEVEYVADRDTRELRMRRVVEELAASGRRPFAIPVGASTPLGAMGYVRAVQELVKQGIRPDAIVHSTSSGGTQAGLVTGCAIAGLDARVLGVSADEAADLLGVQIEQIVKGMPEIMPFDSNAVFRAQEILVSDEFVGAGYGIPTNASRTAAQLVARMEGIFLDPTYTAKAMAGLFKFIEDGVFDQKDTVLFWHTGGLPGIFQ